MDFTIILVIIGALVAITNVITEVLKKATWDKVPTNIVALLVGESLSLATGFAYCGINNVSLTWYIAAALIVGGFMVAYGAMFGFDKLKEVLEWDKKYGGGSK